MHRIPYSRADMSDRTMTMGMGVEEGNRHGGCGAYASGIIICTGWEWRTMSSQVFDESVGWGQEARNICM